MKVMVATDGTPTAFEAAERSMDLLQPDAEIVVVTIVPEEYDPMEDAGGFEGPLMTEDEAEKEFAERLDRGQSAVARTSEVIGPPTDRLVITADGEPGKALIEAAAEIQPDVIVVGAADRGTISRVLGGSVSDYVIHHAPCPVLVVRHLDPEG